MSTRRNQSTGRLEPMAMLSPLFDPAQGPPPPPRPADSMLGVLPGSPASGVHLFAHGWASSVVAAGSGRLVWESCSCRRTGLWPGLALKAVGAETQAQALQRGDLGVCPTPPAFSVRGPPALSLGCTSSPTARRWPASLPRRRLGWFPRLDTLPTLSPHLPDARAPPPGVKDSKVRSWARPQLAPPPELPGGKKTFPTTEERVWACGGL